MTMHIYRVLFIVVTCLLCQGLDAQRHQHEVIGMLLDRAAGLPADSNRVLHFARQLSGTPYQGGTLDRQRQEHLVVRTDSVDCTTFVETVLALALTCDGRYTTFCRHLRTLRYRQGKLDGYASRLHYFSDWIADNEQMQLVEEVTCQLDADTLTKDIHFMTAHPQHYLDVTGIDLIERRLSSAPFCYIPKNRIAAAAGIRDGDIIALTTNIDGLDISHVGIALWRNGVLHLIHASSVRKKVIIDPQPLAEYMAGIRSQTGIRVIRLRQ